MVTEWLMKPIIEVHLHKVEPIVYHSKEYGGIVSDFELFIGILKQTLVSCFSGFACIV